MEVYTNKSRFFIGLLSIFTLIIGILIYLLFRDLNNIILFSWIQKPQFYETVLVSLKPSIFSYFISYHLPDMFWFISGILFLRFIWFYNTKIQTIYIWCFYFTGFVFETSQLSEKIPGTFDRLDLLFMGIGAFIEGTLNIIFLRRRFL